MAGGDPAPHSERVAQMRDPIAEKAFNLGEALLARGRVRADIPELAVDPFRLARGEEQPREPIRCIGAEGRRLFTSSGRHSLSRSHTRAVQLRRAFRSSRRGAG
jgi:hypothetical protein